MSLSRKDYFELKATEKKQIQKALGPPTIFQKAGYKFVKVFPTPFYQQGQKLVTGDSTRPFSAQKWHERNLHNKPC